MAVTLVGTGTPLALGGTDNATITASPALPTGTTTGDRIFFCVSFRGGNVLPPSGWTKLYMTTYPGLGVQGVATGPRMQAVFWRDYAAGWVASDTAFLVSGDFSGASALVATMVGFRKGAGEEFNEPYFRNATDSTVDTAVSANFGNFPMMNAARGFVLTSYPTTTTVTAPTLTGSPTPTLSVNQGTTLGDDVHQTIHTFSPTTTAFTANTTFAATTNAARPAECCIILQDLIAPIDKPIVERITAYENKFDPRTGNTGLWLGSDVARSIPIPGTNNTLWIFADTLWRTSTTPTIPTSRAGYQFTNSSLALQTGADLATATVTFHRAPGGGNWFNVDASYTCWPIDAIFIGNDLYVFGVRVLSSNMLGGEYGWTVHRIPNAKTTAITSWPVATLLYASGDTGSRPINSPYDGGDGYIYSFAIARQPTGTSPAGWRWCRWPVASLTGTDQNLVEWWNGTGWQYGDATQLSSTPSMSIADNPVTSEGSVHKRSIDGRWIITEAVGPMGLVKQDLAIRLTQSFDGFGNWIGWGTNGYLPPPPNMQVGDFVKDGAFSAKILSIASDGQRFLRYEIDNTYGLKPTTSLVSVNRTERYIYRNPRMDPDPGYFNYATKAHPLLSDSTGLVASFVDNSSSTAIDNDLSVYWPKFVRVKPPLISNFSYNLATGAVTWQVTGAPDGQFISVNGGPYTSIDPLARSYSAPANSYVTLLARGIGGDSLINSSPTSKLRVGPNLVPNLYLGSTRISAAYLGTNKL